MEMIGDDAIYFHPGFNHSMRINNLFDLGLPVTYKVSVYNIMHGQVMACLFGC